MCVRVFVIGLNKISYFFSYDKSYFNNRTFKTHSDNTKTPPNTLINEMREVNDRRTDGRTDA